MPFVSRRPHVEPKLRRARAAVSALFFVNAVLYSTLVPRLPEVKDELDLSKVESTDVVYGLGTVQRVVRS